MPDKHVTSVREKPILFSAAMVRAILDGAKTQTRRTMWCEKRPNGTTLLGRQKWHYVPLRSAPILYCAEHPEKPRVDVVSPDTGNVWGWRKKLGRFLPKWAIRIWLEIESVRVERLQDISEEDAKTEGIEAIHNERAERIFWKNYRFKTAHPRRGTTVTDEEHRIHAYGDLIVDDAFEKSGAKKSYKSLWESINGPGSWALNPWVWALTFKRAEEPK